MAGSSFRSCPGCVAAFIVLINGQLDKVAGKRTWQSLATATGNNSRVSVLLLLCKALPGSAGTVQHRYC